MFVWVYLHLREKESMFVYVCLHPCICSSDLKSANARMCLCGYLCVDVSVSKNACIYVDVLESTGV